jgi:hypothetical protein
MIVSPVWVQVWDCDSGEKGFSCFDPSAGLRTGRLSMNEIFVSVFNVSSVRPEPFDFAQDRLVEG